MKLYITENNSGGYTKILGCCIDEPTEEKPYLMVVVDCETVDKGIDKFESRFLTNVEYENCYEGGSCSCCGRRFEFHIEGDNSNTSRKYVDVRNSTTPHYNYDKYKKDGVVLEL